VGTTTGKEAKGEARMQVKRSTNAPMHPALQNKPSSDEAAWRAEAVEEAEAGTIGSSEALLTITDRPSRLLPAVLTLSLPSEELSYALLLGADELLLP
jgi:hypothetical protein